LGDFGLVVGGSQRGLVALAPNTLQRVAGGILKRGVNAKVRVLEPETVGGVDGKPEEERMQAAQGRALAGFIRSENDMKITGAREFEHLIFERTEAAESDAGELHCAASPGRARNKADARANTASQDWSKAVRSSLGSRSMSLPQSSASKTA